MRRFRETLRRCRLVVLTVLFVAAFYGVEGHLFSQVWAMARQDEARLGEMSERLGIPVERLRRDNPSLVDTLMNLVSDPDERFRSQQLERLEAAIQRSRAEVDANPYRDRIAAVKNEHRRDKTEGLLRDLAELSSLRVLRLRPAARRALLRNLKSALREGLVLPPLPAGLPAQAEARHREMEDRLRRLAGDLEPLLSAPEALSEGRLSRTVADLAGAVNGAVSRPRRDAPRFRETPLPVQRMERQAPTAPASRTGSRAPTPAATSSPAVTVAGRPRTSGVAAAGAPTPFGPIATEITALAGELGNSPARIFTWVHDNVAYDPKWGQVRSPLGTLLEKTGTSWDQAALLAELLTAAGVDARLEWGEVEIPAELLLEITGTANPTDAGGVLATGGVPIVLQQIASQVVTAKISHVWVKAHVDYIPNRGVTPGPADTWIRMDPSFKRSSYQPGIAVHQSVPYGLGDYLQSATPLAPRRFREEALWAYIRANDIECTTLEQLKKAGSIVQEDFPYIPGTLRGKIVSVAGEDTAVPESFRHRLRVEVKESGGLALLAWEQPWAEVWGARTQIAWVGATPADEAIIASFGSLFDTPPYLVDLVPTVRVGGVEVARGSALGSARDTEVWVTLLETSGEATTLTHDTLAGEHHVLALDFGRLPQRLIDDHQVALAAALAAGDDFEAEAETLYLLGAQYMHNLGRDLDDLAGWNWQRLVKLGTEGLISQTGIVTTTLGGAPIGFRRGERNVDVARMILGIFPADGDHQYKTATFELLGSQSSYLEGLVFNQVLQREGIASVSALTRSKRDGQTLTRVDGSNVGTVLAQVDLGTEAEQAVAFAVSQGKIAWVAEAPVTVNQWTGTGYVLEDPATGAAGYLISGQLAGGSDTGPLAAAVREFLGTESWVAGTPLGEFLLFLLSLAEVAPGGGVPGGGGPESVKADPINLVTGNLFFTETDLAIRARGLPIVWSRTYNSRSTYNGPMGYGWTFSYGQRLEEQLDDSVVYREADGTEHVFTPDGAGGYDPPDGKHLTLVKGADFTLRTKTGFVWRFALGGRFLSLMDPNGNTVSLQYDALGNLQTITDAAGRVLLTVITSSGKITQVTDSSGRTMSYSYTGEDLTTFTDTAGQPWSFAYDSNHNLLSRDDPLGNTDAYAYDTLDRCVRHTDALGNQESFAYSSTGSSAVLTDRRGFDTYLEFDERGRATLEVDPLGNAWRSNWDAANNRISTTDPRGGTTTRNYDASGNLLSETNTLNETTTWTYDPEFSQVLTKTDPSNHTITNTYDASGNLIERSQVVAGETLTESFDYDAFGQVLEHRDARDKPTNFAWDVDKGSLETHTDALNRTTTLVTDDLGRTTEILDPELNSVATGWDDRDRLVALTDSFVNATTVVYDDAGRKTDLTTPLGTTTTDYDAAGRSVATTDPQGNMTRTEYDPEGNVTTRIDAKGNRWTTTYDAIGRTVATTDPLGGLWTFEHCAELGVLGGCQGGSCSTGGSGGNFCSVTDPQGNTTTREHDDLGRVVSVTDPLGNRIETIYDELGRGVATRDALQNLTQFEYDEIGRLTAVVEANGARTEYTYDGNGNLVNVRDAELRNWPRTYDDLNRLETESDPLGSTTTLTYDTLGNLASRLNPNGELITSDYDVRRLTAVNLPGGAQETFSYDGLGRRTGMANSEVSITRTYDSLNRLVSVSNNSLGQVISYAYDANGNLTEMVGPAGPVAYFYDAKNRLVEQQDPVSGSYAYAYDELDRRVRLDYPNGLATEYEYDSAGRLESILSRRRETGEVLDGYAYTYDPVGNRTQMALLHDPTVHEYQYDDTYRLTRWDRGPDRFEEYVLDDVGNREILTDNLGSITYSFDSANRLQSALRSFDAGGAANTGYEWDASGNLTQKSAGGLITEYEWDALNRLLRLTDAQGVHTYGYDPNGVRVRETNAGDSVRFLHSGEDIIGAYDGSANLSTYFSHGPGIDEPLAQNTLVDGTAFLHRDGLGSVTALSLPDGQMTGARTYSAFGGVEASTGPPSRYGYTGRELDSTGEMYYRARYYSPADGRFLSTDPQPGIQEIPQSFNQFSYALSNPVNLTDPFGDTSVAEVIKVFFILIGIYLGSVATLTILAWVGGAVINCLSNLNCILSSVEAVWPKSFVSTGATIALILQALATNVIDPTIAFLFLFNVFVVLYMVSIFKDFIIGLSVDYGGRLAGFAVGILVGVLFAVNFFVGWFYSTIIKIKKQQQGR